MTAGEIALEALHQSSRPHSREHSLVVPLRDLGARALSLAVGGANSYGAVVAREYGIPAVVGVPGATNRMTTSQQVTVDGTRGLVTAADVPDERDSVGARRG